MENIKTLIVYPKLDTKLLNTQLQNSPVTIKVKFDVSDLQQQIYSEISKATIILPKNNLPINSTKETDTIKTLSNNLQSQVTKSVTSSVG